MIPINDNFITVNGINLRDSLDKSRDKLKEHIEDSMIVLPLWIRVLHYFPLFKKYYKYKLEENNTKKFK
jgi:hypothetical protein